MADNRLTLTDNNRIAVMGGGPAGAFFAYFTLLFAERVGLEVEVDVYEPRDFSRIGPGGCNMCGGIISESLVQNLAMEGIDLPEKVVQRGIDSYVMHTEAGSSRIETPTQEKRVAAVHRGGGPRTLRVAKWSSFDGHLLQKATGKGARVIPARINELEWDDGRPRVRAKGLEGETYDLLAGALGMNSPEIRLFEALGFEYQRPESVKTYITELAFTPQEVRQLFGSSMHVFLLNLPRLDFAALIPKGDFVTLCLLGTNIDKPLIRAFFEHRAVRSCFPPGWVPPLEACQCGPRMSFGKARSPFADRLVLVGDCGVSRLYKDGIGAAFRTARAAARTAVFEGIDADSFRTGYLPEYRKIDRDNRFGRVLFSGVHLIRHLEFSSRAVLSMVAREQNKPGAKRQMSSVLWDVFTGSAPYREIFFRALNPLFLIRFLSLLGYAAGTFYRPFSAPGSTRPLQIE